jgi:hypothetical protein
MKAKNKKTGKETNPPEEGVLREVASVYHAEAPMVRTQIYLSRVEHEFIQAEASRQGQPMAAVIRAYIDEKMSVPDEVWDDNPLLRAPVPDESWKGRDDGAANHDHYIYGAPKKWTRHKGELVETPPLPEDYYTNPRSRQEYDEKVNRRK